MSCLLDTKLHIFDRFFLAIELHIAFFTAIFAAIFTCPPGRPHHPSSLFYFLTTNTGILRCLPCFLNLCFLVFPTAAACPKPWVLIIEQQNAETTKTNEKPGRQTGAMQ